MTKQMTSNLVTEIAKEMQEAMAAIEKKYDVKIGQKGNISYDDSQFKIKYEVKIDDNEIQTEKARINFERASAFHDFNQVGFGQTYKSGDKILKVIGFNSRASKNPIELEDQNGNKYKTTIASYNKQFPF